MIFNLYNIDALGSSLRPTFPLQKPFLYDRYIYGVIFVSLFHGRIWVKKRKKKAAKFLSPPFDTYSVMVMSKIKQFASRSNIITALHQRALK